MKVYTITISLYKRLVSIDEETDEILKKLPNREASDFVRDAVKLKARTLSTDEPKRKEQEPAKVEEKIPTVRIKA